MKKFAVVVAVAVLTDMFGYCGRNDCCAQGRFPSVVTVVDSLEVSVFFYTNKTDIDAYYHENGGRIREFAENYRKIAENRDVTILSFDVVSGASPEGHSSDNDGLSQGRARSIIQMVGRYVDISDISVNVRSAGSDWNRFRMLVGQSPLDSSEKSQIIDIIDSGCDNGSGMDDRLQRIRNVDGGSAYSYIQKSIFPELRASKAYFYFSYETLVLSADASSAVSVTPDMERSEINTTGAITVGTSLRLTPPLCA